MTINDLYRQLFGRGGTRKGTDIEMSEHGRVGGLSTGQPFKFVSLVGSATGDNSFDDLSAGLITVGFDHHKLHEGNTFLVNEVYDQAINNTVDIRITTPNTTKWAHLLVNFDVESETQWYFYETAVISQAGTAFTPRNLNRNSSNTSGLAVDIITNTSLANANADTDVTGATALMHGIVGSGKAEGGNPSMREEFILKQNTIYDIRLISTVAGWIHINTVWYEHTSVV